MNSFLIIEQMKLIDDEQVTKSHNLLYTTYLEHEN